MLDHAACWAVADFANAEKSEQRRVAVDGTAVIGDLIRMLGRNWWLVALRGVLALIFGLLALVWPGITLLVLLIFFGAYSLVDGATGVVRAIRSRKSFSRWWLMLLGGLAGIVVGIVTFVWPSLTAQALLILIGVWAVLLGILEIWAGIEARKAVAEHWWVIISGVIGVIFGVLLLALPVAGALAIVWLIGLFAILEGITFVWAGFMLRGAVKKLQSLAGTTSAV